MSSCELHFVTSHRAPLSSPTTSRLRLQDPFQVLLIDLELQHMLSIPEFPDLWAHSLRFRLAPKASALSAASWARNGVRCAGLVGKMDNLSGTEKERRLDLLEGNTVPLPRCLGLWLQVPSACCSCASWQTLWTNRSQRSRLKPQDISGHLHEQINVTQV